MQSSSTSRVPPLLRLVLVMLKFIIKREMTGWEVVMTAIILTVDSILASLSDRRLSSLSKIMNLESIHQIGRAGAHGRWHHLKATFNRRKP